VFDYGVNSGPGHAAQELQKLLGVTADGNIGPGTLSAVAACEDVGKLISLYCAARLGYLKALQGWETFGDGWEPRVKRVEERALSMAGASHSD
jgi:lysozyme family protein